MTRRSRYGSTPTPQGTRSASSPLFSRSRPQADQRVIPGDQLILSVVASSGNVAPPPSWLPVPDPVCASRPQPPGDALYCRCESVTRLNTFALACIANGGEDRQSIHQL